MKTFQIEIPDELFQLLGSESDARREIVEALIMNLVRKGQISRAKAAEWLGLSL